MKEHRFTSLSDEALLRNVMQRDYSGSCSYYRGRWPNCEDLNRRETAHRTTETAEPSQAWDGNHAEYLATQRAAETLEQLQARRLQQATYMASQSITVMSNIHKKHVGGIR
ncbi:hypothetical protein TNCV_760071 [Trichonephila clavipes]|nr:hypothetical protein TNCV_760071 [Trichonephila clavipes]